MRWPAITVARLNVDDEAGNPVNPSGLGTEGPAPSSGAPGRWSRLVGTLADIDDASRRHGGLGLFLRSLTGLDRAAAMAAFDQFQAGRTLSSRELDFLNLLVNYLARNGVVETEALYEPPFTRLAPHGPDAVFASKDLDVIVEALHTVRHTAIPAPQAS